MAHFALLDENNIVQQVAVISEAKLAGIPQPVPQEVINGRTFLQAVPGRWVQTSYNATFRKKFAAIGDEYNDALDAFIPPKPYPSWQLNTATCLWQPPIPMPTDGADYSWDEENLIWIQTTE